MKKEVFLLGIFKEQPSDRAQAVARAMGKNGGGEPNEAQIRVELGKIKGERFLVKLGFSVN